ncbi:glycosyl hydrolase family 28-related protein [uncultured Veillonella sp.]|uniref:glycosyl hydrolase family 28-related protein n=1 Tax=uncultured Veillonella sp. TaxID=159268 RepID=UPI00262BE544|nr:glycosyl hydrolase family 28-related protein [uncultured Veillonella sp.]
MIPQVNNPVVQYQCDGVNKTFIWPYDFNNIKDINLILVDEDGRQTEQTGNILYDAQNKTLTYPSIGDPLPATHKVVLIRRTPISQTTELSNKWPYNHIEDMSDKVILILQELKEQLDRTLQIRVGADEDPNQVVRDIVDNSLVAAKQAIEAALTAETKALEVEKNAVQLNAINDNINALSQTVDDKLATANTALIQSADTFEKTQVLADNTKAYAAQAETDKKNINDLVTKADAIKTDINNKQIASTGNAKKAEDAAKRAEVAAAKAEEIAIPGGKGIVTKSEADAKYIGKESLNGIVSVKDFGAVGDGVTDDTAAFKRANDNLANKILLVPNGQYKLTEHLTFNTVGSVMDMGVYTNIKPYYPTETPMLKGASNIALVKNITYDAEVNQCQGFTYNSKKNVFILACVNGEGTNQILYELNPDTFEKVGTYKFTDSERLGHCNTMTYNRYTNKIYITNGLKNGNNLTVINADTMAIENTITLQEKVFNIDYDPITRTYVSIVPIAGNQRVRTINLYNDDFKKLKTYQVDYIYPDMNNNGAFMLNGAIMSATLGSLVECTPFGTVKQIIEINRETEIEDIAYYNGKFYFAVLTQKPNRRHQVDIYVGDPNYDFENSINMQRLKNLDYLGLGGGKMKGPIIMPNNTSVQVVDTKGSAHHAVKMSTRDSIEFGMSDNRTIFLGTSIGYHDANKNKTFRILTEDDASSTGTLVSKKDADAAYLGKQGNQVIPNGGLSVKRGFVSYDDVTQIDDWAEDNANRLIIKRVAQANGAPQNGVLLEYSQGNGQWRGRLFIADNGNDGVYYGGFSDGQNKGWKKLYGEGQQNIIQFANGAELWVE